MTATSRTTTAPLSGAEQETIKSLLKALRFYMDRQHQYCADRDHAPAHGSPSAAAAGDDILRTPYLVAALLDVVALDHLRTVGAVLDAGFLPSYACHSLLRVVLETSARTWWVLDPDVTPQHRAARGVLTRLAMLEERAKLERGAGNARERIQELRDGAQRAGLDVVPDEKGRVAKVDGVGFSDTTSVLRQMLPEEGPETGMAFGEFLYRMLSGATHGTEWMALLNATPVPGTERDGEVLVHTSVDLRQLAWLVSSAVLCHAQAFDRQCQANGWASFIEQPFYQNGVLLPLQTATST